MEPITATFREAIPGRSITREDDSSGPLSFIQIPKTARLRL